MNNIIKNITVGALLALILMSSVGVDIYFHICGSTGERSVFFYYKGSCSEENTHTECHACFGKPHSSQERCNSENNPIVNNCCSDISERYQTTFPYLHSAAQRCAPEPVIIELAMLALRANDDSRFSINEMYFREILKLPPIIPVNICRHILYQPDEEDIAQS